MIDQARDLLAALLSTEQFAPAIRLFVAGYVNDSQQKMRHAVKSGDIPRSNYECGVLDSFEGLLSRMESFAKAPRGKIS